MSLREVKFDEYCSRCYYKDKDENEKPCYECLKVSAKENSRKPIKFVEGVNK